MKKTYILLILILLISFISCDDKKTEILTEKISHLEIQNQKLKDSITKFEYDKVENSRILGLTFKPTFQVGENSQVNFIFSYPEKIMTYDVYTSTDDGEPDELIFKNLTNNQFDYDFVPTKIGEEQIELIAVFKMNDSLNTEFHIPTNTTVTIK